MIKDTDKKNQRNRGVRVDEPRINTELRCETALRLVVRDAENPENNGSKILSFQDAFDMAKRLGLDLIEINPSANPPVVTLADYSKYLWDLKKKAKEREKNKGKSNTPKEVQLTANISEHDIDTKVRKAAEFIAKGEKVKIVLTLKGRQLGRRDESKKSFYVFLDKLSDCCNIAFDTQPIDEGRRFIAIVRRK